MKILVKRCSVCGALGVGPNPVKLWPFEGRLYCKDDYDQPLQWHEQRSHVVGGLAIEVSNAREAPKVRRRLDHPPKPARRDWRGYIAEHAEMAAIGLFIGDKRIFVKHFALALYAQTLKEDT